MTNKQRAKALGVSESLWYDLRQQGLPEDIEEARAWLLDREARKRQGRPLSTNKESFEQARLNELLARTRKEQALAKKHEIENRKRMDELLDRDTFSRLITHSLQEIACIVDELPRTACDACNPGDPRQAEAELRKIIEAEIKPRVIAGIQKFTGDEQLSGGEPESS